MLLLSMPIKGGGGERVRRWIEGGVRGGILEGGGRVHVDMKE